MTVRLHLLPIALGLALGLALAATAFADVIVAARSMPAGTILAADDLLTVPGNQAGSFAGLAGVVGLKLNAAVRGGHPILTSQIDAPVLIARNATITAYYYHNGIVLATAGRALDSGALGDTIQFMNVASNRTLSGQVQADGTILVNGSLLPQP